jgi:hypothetical protein
LPVIVPAMCSCHTAIFRCYSILSRSCCSVMPIFCLCQGASLVLAIFRCYSILSRSCCSVMPMLPAMCSCHTAIFKCYSILSRSWCSVMLIFLPMSGCQPCAPATQPSSGVIVYSPETGALLCQFFAYVRVRALC